MFIQKNKGVALSPSKSKITRRLSSMLALVFTVAGVGLVGVQPAIASTALSAPAAIQIGTLNTFVNICTGSCDVSGYDDSVNLKTEVALVTEGSGYLKLGTTAGISTAPAGYTTAEWTASNSTKLGFIANQTTTNSILEQLQYSSRTTGTSRQVKITTSQYTGNDAYDPVSGHFYEVVNFGSSIGWRDARCKAKWGSDSAYGGGGVSAPSDDQCTNKADGIRRQMYGLNGYLSNITSLDEHKFLQAYMPNSTVGWIGGSDHVGTTEDGIWRWFDGPESNQVFFVQTARSPYNTLSNRRTTNPLDGRNMFNYFSDGEPNGAGSGEDYAEFGFGTNDVGDSWNDCGANCTRTYFIVEYGGDGGNLAGLATNNVTVVTPVAAAVASKLSPTSTTALVPGSTLTSQVTFTGYPIPVETITWQRSLTGTSDWQNISGQSSATYLLSPSDVGYFIRSSETGTVYVNDAANSTATAASDPTAIIGLAAPSAAPDLAAASDSGSSVSDNRTSDTTPTFDLAGLTIGATATITAIKASTASVSCTSATARADGTSSCTFASPLEDGGWQLTVSQSLNEQTSALSSVLSITVDTQAPQLALASPPTPNKSVLLVYTLSSAETLQASPQVSDFTITGDSSCVVSAVTGTGPYEISIVNCGAPKTIGLALKSSVVFDLAGNSNDSVSAATVSTDRSAPTVTAIGFTTPNATYGVGQEINIVVDMSETVSVNGSPRLELNSATGRLATYVSSAGDKIYFKYIVQAGDSATDLGYTSTTALSLNGSTVVDLAANSADLTLAAPASADSLAASGAIVVDTSPAALTLAAITTGPTELTTIRFRVSADSRNLNCSSISLVNGVDFAFANITSIVVTPSVALNRCEIVATVSLTPGQQGIAALTPTAGLAISDTLGNTSGFAHLTATGATVAVEVPALPVVTSSSLDGNGRTLTLVFTRALNSTGPNKTAFTLRVNGEIFEIVDTITVSSTSVVLNSKRTIFALDSATLSYSDPTAENDETALQDLVNDADVATFYNLSITNASLKTAEAAPANSKTMTVLEGSSLTLTAPVGRTFSAVYFASYGTPTADFKLGTCHATTSSQRVAAVFIGQNTATIQATNVVFGDPCATVGKTLKVVLLYSADSIAPISATPTPAASVAAGEGSVAKNSVNGVIPRVTPALPLGRMFGDVSPAAQAALLEAKVFAPVSSASGQRVATDFSNSNPTTSNAVTEAVSISAGEKLNFEIKVDEITASDHVTAGYLKKSTANEWIYLGQKSFSENWARSEFLTFTEPGLYLVKIIVIPDGASNLKIANVKNSNPYFAFFDSRSLVVSSSPTTFRRATISDSDVAIGLRTLDVEITVTTAVFPEAAVPSITPSPTPTPSSTPSPTATPKPTPSPTKAPKPKPSSSSQSGGANQNSENTSGQQSGEGSSGNDPENIEPGGADGNAAPEETTAELADSENSLVAWWPLLLASLIVAFAALAMRFRRKSS